MPPFNPRTIAIVGLGLMGGSLAAACRKKFPRTHIIGISRSRSARKIAFQKKWVHQAARNLRQGAAQADFIVVCTPVDTLKKMLAEIDQAAKPCTIVTDVGSVKGEIARWAARKKFKNIQFVSSHPMAGSHAQGIDAACENLYENSLTFAIRAPGASRQAAEAVNFFWRRISGRVVEATPERHDFIVSNISHLPHALAVCLMLCVPPELLKFSGRGFRDTTRIAQGHPSIWGPIFSANRANVAAALSRFEKVLRQFKSVLKEKQEASLRGMLRQAAKRRREISL